eukprot:COSAG01_NODE_3146_length_6516_cov_1.829983_3_plen_124_part_00
MIGIPCTAEEWPTVTGFGRIRATSRIINNILKRAQGVCAGCQTPFTQSSNMMATHFAHSDKKTKGKYRTKGMRGSNTGQVTWDSTLRDPTLLMDALKELCLLCECRCAACRALQTQAEINQGI